jgi:hypothetical protein
VRPGKMTSTFDVYDSLGLDKNRKIVNITGGSFL